MSTVIHNHTRKSDIYRPAGAVIALWEDVVAATSGNPYSLELIAGICSAHIARAKKRGYFTELLARRIHDATVQRVPLIPNVKIKSGQRLKEQERVIAKRYSK